MIIYISCRMNVVPVQSLGGLVSALLQLADVTSLLDEVQKRLRQSLVGDGPGCVVKK